MTQLDFKNGFKRARMSTGLTQNEFADTYNFSFAAIRKWEQGKAVPEAGTLERLCEIFKCDLSYLFYQIDNTTHDLQFVCDQLELSEDAVNGLKEMTRDYADALNFILSNRRGLMLLEDICRYIAFPSSSSSVSFTDDGEVVAPTVFDLGLAELKGISLDTIHEIEDTEKGFFANYTRTVSTEKMIKQVFMSDIQGGLNKLRETAPKDECYRSMSRFITRRDVEGAE